MKKPYSKFVFHYGKSKPGCKYCCSDLKATTNRMVILFQSQIGKNERNSIKTILSCKYRATASVSIIYRLLGGYLKEHLWASSTLWKWSKECQAISLGPGDTKREYGGSCKNLFPQGRRNTVGGRSILSLPSS